MRSQPPSGDRDQTSGSPNTGAQEPTEPDAGGLDAGPEASQVPGALETQEGDPEDPRPLFFLLEPEAPGETYTALAGWPYLDHGVQIEGEGSSPEEAMHNLLEAMQGTLCEFIRITLEVAERQRSQFLGEDYLLERDA